MKGAAYRGRTALRLAVGVALLVWIFHAIFVQEGRQAWAQTGGEWESLGRGQQWRIAWSHGPKRLWSTLCLVPPGALLASLGFMGLTIVLGMVRWRWVLGVPGLNLSFRRTAEISLAAHFFNSFLLGSTGGDVLKAYYAARETRHKKTEAVTTVFADRLLGLFAMLLFAALMIVPNLELVTARGTLSMLASLILAMLAACSLLAGLSFWGGVSARWPQPRAWLAKLPRGDLLLRSVDACHAYGQRRGLLAKALGISMLLNLCCVLQFVALARGLGIRIDWTPLSMIVPTIICVSALPITPSGLGVRENLYVLTLSLPELNVPATQALSLSLLAYAGSLFWSVIGGMIYVFVRERWGPEGDAADESPDGKSGDRTRS